MGGNQSGKGIKSASFACTECTSLAARRATASCRAQQRSRARTTLMHSSVAHAFGGLHVGNLNGLVGILLGHVQGDSGDAPLRRPG